MEIIFFKFLQAIFVLICSWPFLFLHHGWLTSHTADTCASSSSKQLFNKTILKTSNKLSK